MQDEFASPGTMSVDCSHYSHLDKGLGSSNPIDPLASVSSRSCPVSSGFMYGIPEPRKVKGYTYSTRILLVLGCRVPCCPLRPLYFGFRGVGS